MNKITRTEDIGFKGSAVFTVTDKNGKVKKLWNENRLGKYIRTSLGADLRIPLLLGFWRGSLKVNNLITNAGRALVASRFNGVGAEALVDRLAVGTGTAAAAVTDTALQAEITTGGLARAVATLSRITHTVTNDTARLDLTWTASAVHAVTECGAFNAATAGTMPGRMVFAAVNLAIGDQFRVIYDYRFSS